MAASELYTVTKLVSTTEWSMTADSAGPVAKTDKVFVQADFDVSALAAGDEFELKIYEKISSGGTQRLISTRRLIGAQSNPIFAIPGLLLLWGWDFTLKKIAGTDRSIVSSIRIP